LLTPSEFLKLVILFYNFSWLLWLRLL